MENRNIFIGANSEMSKNIALFKKMLKKINSSSGGQPAGTPVIVSEKKMQEVHKFLREKKYTIEHCAVRLGTDITGGVNFISLFRKNWKADYCNPLDVLISLFIDNEELKEEQVILLMGNEIYEDFLEMHLLKKKGEVVYSEFCLFPCYGDVYILTDKVEKEERINQVMFLWGESFFLADVIEQGERYSNVLDLCTGSGIHALIQSRHCDSVVGVDISERAIAFANFSKALNGIKNVEFQLGNVFESVKQEKFDLIIANPPYNPDLDTKAGDNFWSGGKLGDEVLKQIFANITVHLKKNGVFFVISLFPNKAGYSNQDSIHEWMGRKLKEYSVLDFTYPAENFVCPHVKNVPSVASKDYKFGLIAMKYNGDLSGKYRCKNNQYYTFGMDGKLKEERISRNSF